MSTITLPNERTSSDVTMRTRLKDGGVAIDWASLTDIKAWLYSDAQKALMGRCDVSITQADSTLLACDYAATKPQYPGIARLIVQAKYQGRTKTYDKPAFNFVPRTAQATGQETIDDPTVDVEIEVEDVSSSILDAAIAAALQAAEDAEAAAHLVPLEVLQDCVEATGNAQEATEDAQEATEAANAAKDAALEAAAAAEAAGITSVVARMEDDVPGTPSVDATLLNKVLTLVFHYLKGAKGDTGATPAISIGTVTTGAAGSAVEVTITGTAAAPVLNFKIPQGLQGTPGIQGLQGNQGNTGSSVDYPFVLVNNRITDDATAALTAAEGKRIGDDIDQINQKLVGVGINLATIWTQGALNSSGAVVASGNNYQRYSQFIPINPAKLYRVTAAATQGSRLAIAQYTSASESGFISGYSAYEIYFPSTLIFKPAANAQYIRVMKSDNPSYAADYGVFELSEKDITKLPNGLKKTDFSWLGMDTVGVQYVSKEFTTNKYFDIETVKSVTFGLESRNDGVWKIRVWHYDAALNYVGRTEISSTTVYTFPEGVKYIRVTLGLYDSGGTIINDRTALNDGSISVSSLETYFNIVNTLENSAVGSLIVDLPVSDGTDIASGYAYIDSTDRTVKVKA